MQVGRARTQWPRRDRRTRDCRATALRCIQAGDITEMKTEMSARCEDSVHRTRIQAFVQRNFAFQPPETGIPRRRRCPPECAAQGPCMEYHGAATHRSVSSPNGGNDPPGRTAFRALAGQARFARYASRAHQRVARRALKNTGRPHQADRLMGESERHPQSCVSWGSHHADDRVTADAGRVPGNIAR